MEKIKKTTQIYSCTGKEVNNLFDLYRREDIPKQALYLFYMKNKTNLFQVFIDRFDKKDNSRTYFIKLKTFGIAKTYKMFSRSSTICITFSSKGIFFIKDKRIVPIFLNLFA